MSLTGVPRPLKFNSLNEFVLSNSNRFEESYNQPKSPKNGIFLIRNQQSYFDSYNVNNLLLSKVHKNHIQVVSKNIVLNEEDINPNKILSQTSGSGTKPFAQTMQPALKQNNFIQTNVTGVNYTQNGNTSPKKPMPHTSQGFYIPQQHKSKEYSQNQLMFNFNKIAQQKKAKKMQFLQTIEAKLSIIEQQAKDLEECHFEQELNIRQIEKIKDEMGRQIKTNAFNARITQKIQNNLQLEDDQDEYRERKPKSLHMNMGHVEINHVLQSHFDENQKLLDEIIRVKSKSKDKTSANNTGSQWNQSPDKSKQFQRTGGPQNFNKTSISQGKGKNHYQSEQQKKIISATMRLPPKHGKR